MKELITKIIISVEILNNRPCMKKISEFRGLFIEFKLKINCDNILEIVSEGKFWFFVDFA